MSQEGSWMFAELVKPLLETSPDLDRHSDELNSFIDSIIGPARNTGFDSVGDATRMFISELSGYASISPVMHHEPVPDYWNALGDLKPSERTVLFAELCALYVASFDATCVNSGPAWPIEIFLVAFEKCCRKGHVDLCAFGIRVLDKLPVREDETAWPEAELRHGLWILTFKMLLENDVHLCAKENPLRDIAADSLFHVKTTTREYLRYACAVYWSEPN